MVKNRLHLDLIAPSTIDEEVGRRWTVMHDPEGNEFCVCARVDAEAVTQP